MGVVHKRKNCEEIQCGCGTEAKNLVRDTMWVWYRSQEFVRRYNVCVKQKPGIWEVMLYNIGGGIHIGISTMMNFFYVYVVKESDMTNYLSVDRNSVF